MKMDSRIVRLWTPVGSGVVPVRAGNWRWVLPPLAIGGALVCAIQLALWFRMGAWPPHDTAAYWLAGVHLREGAPVYASDGVFLAFLYAPPWAVLSAAASFLPLHVLSAVLLFGQILALRYIAGSWIVAGLLAWLPFVPRELATGNIDLLMGAGILAGVRGTGWPVALFAAAKMSPALVLLGGRGWWSALIAGAFLFALTLPWLHLWPEWFGMLASNPSGGDSWIPLLWRAPLVVALLALRRPWALAAAAAFATPAFHFHSLVLLLPAGRLWLERR